MATAATQLTNGNASETSAVGVLTKSVIRSPVVRWILQARIRDAQHNDVVFVGDDFIHVKEVREHGHLEHVATKCDFDARIRAAKTFIIEEATDDEDFFIKNENGDVPMTDARTPPQCIILTLATNDLLFLSLTEDDTGSFRFVHAAFPLPVFDRMLFQPGEHLAVDPHSRALAVAANEREVVIYSTKASDLVTHELRSGQKDWHPIAAQRPLQVDGVIQHMDFLIPPSEDEGHVILLLILVDRQRTKAVWIDWYVNTDLHNAHIHPGQPLDTARGVSSLVIPLRNASFFLINGSEVKRWTNLLCGSVTGSEVLLLKTEPLNPGASPREPAWVNWCRPRRIQETTTDADHLYLLREDGVVLLLQAAHDVLSSHAGDFDCHIGTAFASLGDTYTSDILVAAGDMSSGRIYSIGHWATPIRLADMDRPGTMVMELVETVPNWASVTDMVTSTFPGKSQRPRDGIFVTSGRQPYGAIAELRRGLEARLSAYFELEGLRSVTDVWALPLAAIGHVLLLLSSPSGTMLLDVSPDAGMQSVEEVDEASLALDTGSQTLATAATPQGKLLQVTRGSICLSPGTSANFEDVARIDCWEGCVILAAAIDPAQGVLVTAERSSQPATSYGIVCYILRTEDPDASVTAQIERSGASTLENEPLCLTCFTHRSTTIVFSALADGYLYAFTIEQDHNLRTLDRKAFPASPHGHGICDNIVIIHTGNKSHQFTAEYLIVCGLRDGRIYSVNVNVADGLQFTHEEVVEFSQSPVKLTQPSGDHSIAYAMSGLDTCLLTWSGKGTSLSLQNIWISDKLRPELAQGAIVACAHMPPAHLLSSPDLAESLILVSGDEFLVTTVDRNPGPVPRQMLVSGTPNRLIYAEQQRCLVSASIRYDVRHFPSSLPHGKAEERRQIWPVIDFIPSRGSEVCYSYELQPGERVFALLEWSFKQSDDKTYSFILIGGSYVRSNGSTGGRIRFVQPVNKSWTVVDVKEGRTAKFDAPVYALALLDENTHVACVGRNVIVSRFDHEERKWEQICPPFKLASPGIYITTFDEERICISTAEDSFVTIGLVNSAFHEEEVPEHSFVLRTCGMAPRADASLCHLVTEEAGMPLIATKHGQLAGIKATAPRSDPRRVPESADFIFEAQLPRSLTRIRRCNVRPRWKPKPGFHEGMVHENYIGCAADGTLIGIALIRDLRVLRMLSWVQRLCEWSEEISPHSFQSPPYTVSEQSYARKERVIPIGISSVRMENVQEIVVRTNRSELSDYHIDGDLLGRLLERGGAEALRRVIRAAAERQDRVGEWVRQHLEAELQMADPVIGILDRLLNAWL